MQDIAPYSPGGIGFFGEIGFTAVTARAFPDETDMSWHVLHVSSDRINLICRVARSLGVEFIYLTELLKRPRKKPVRAATFPGYLFARFDPNGERRGYLQATPGVIGILGDEDGNLSAVPDDVVERLRVERDERNQDRDCEWLPSWSPGDELEVLDGPFARFTAIYIGYAGKHVHASVSIFGRTTLAMFNVTDLKAVVATRPKSEFTRYRDD